MSPNPAIERALRGTAWTALAGALLLFVWPPGAPATPRRVDVVLDADDSDRAAARRVQTQLRTLALSLPSRDTIRVIATGLPAPVVRETVRALAALHTMRWENASGIRALVATRDALREPSRGVVLRTVMRADSSVLAVRWSDGGGALDSVRADTTGFSAVALVAREIDGAADITPLGASGARGRVTLGRTTSDSVPRVLVLGRPSWEAKFVLAALEEAGWPVDTRLPASPRAVVESEALRALRADQYGVVVVLDSGLVSASTLRTLLDAGGGVILSGDALTGRGLGALGVPVAEHAHPGVAGGLVTDAPRTGLSAWHMRALGAITLEGAPREASVLARRVGAGRLLMSGYLETWRWRMEGTDDGARAHREWWSTLVRTVAPTPNRAVPTHQSSAPVAAMWDAFGAPTRTSTATRADTATRTVSGDGWRHRAPQLRALLVLVAMATLVVEWLLRRRRGVP